MIGCSVPTVTPSAVFGFGSQFPFGYTFRFGFLLGSPPPHPRLFSVFSFHLPSVYTLFSASVFSDTQLVFGFHWLLGSQRVSPSVLFGFPCFQFQFSVTSVTFGFPSYPSVFSCGTPVYLRFGLIAQFPLSGTLILSVPVFGLPPVIPSVRFIPWVPLATSVVVFLSLVSFTPQVHPVFSFGFRFPVQSYTQIICFDCMVPTEWHPQLFSVCPQLFSVSFFS